MFKGIFLSAIIISLLTFNYCGTDYYSKSGKGKPVILIQGLGCSEDVYDDIISDFTDQFTFYTIKIPGFAGNSKIENFSSEAVEKLISDLIQKENLRKTILIGHSFGGFVALKFASENPEMISKLIIIDSYPYAMGVYNPSIPVETAKQQADLLKQTILSMTNEQYANFVKSTFSMSVTDHSDLNKIVSNYLKSDKSSLVRAQAEMISSDLRNNISNIKIPTLVLCSSVLAKMQGIGEDNFEKNVNELYKNILNCRIEINNKAKHFIMLDSPKWFSEKLTEFLKDE